MTIRSMAAAAAVILAGFPAAQAAPDRLAAATQVAAVEPRIPPVAVPERIDDATCSRARRRLWIGGEGWVVRRITTCR